MAALWRVGPRTGPVRQSRKAFGAVGGVRTRACAAMALLLLGRPHRAADHLAGRSLRLAIPDPVIRLLRLLRRWRGLRCRGRFRSRHLRLRRGRRRCRCRLLDGGIQRPYALRVRLASQNGSLFAPAAGGLFPRRSYGAEFRALAAARSLARDARGRRILGSTLKRQMLLGERGCSAAAAAGKARPGIACAARRVGAARPPDRLPGFPQRRKARRQCDGGPQLLRALRHCARQSLCGLGVRRAPTAANAGLFTRDGAGGGA